MVKPNCKYCDESGFCTKYSNEVTVWKCNICGEYVEEDNG